MKSSRIITFVTLTVALLSILFADELLVNSSISAIIIALFTITNIYSLAKGKSIEDIIDGAIYLAPLAIIGVGAVLTLFFANDLIIIADIAAALAVGACFYFFGKEKICVAVSLVLIFIHLYIYMSSDNFVIPTLLYIALIATYGLTNESKVDDKYSPIIPYSLAIFLVAFVIDCENIMVPAVTPEPVVKQVSAPVETPKPQASEPKKESVSKPVKKSPAVVAQKPQKPQPQKPAAVKVVEQKPLIYRPYKKWVNANRPANFTLTQVTVAPKYTEAIIVVNSTASGTLYLETNSSYSDRAIAIKAGDKSYICQTINGSSSRCELPIESGKPKSVVIRFAPIPRDTKIVTISEGFMGSFHQKGPLSFEFIDVELGQAR